VRDLTATAVFASFFPDVFTTMVQAQSFCLQLKLLTFWLLPLQLCGLMEKKSF